MSPLHRLDSATGMPAVVARRALCLDDDAEGGFGTLPLTARALGERSARAVLRADDRASVVDLQGASGIVIAVWSWALGKLDDTEAVKAMRYARRDVAAGALLRSDPDHAVVAESIVQHAARELDTREVIDLLARPDHAVRIGEYAARLAVASADAMGARVSMTHLHVAALEIAHSAGEAGAGVVPNFDGFDLNNAASLDRSALATLHTLVRLKPTGGADFLKGG